MIQYNLFEDQSDFGDEINTSFSDYEIYHDESVVDGYWHGMLLVPVYQKASFHQLLQSERVKAGYFSKLSFKDVRSRGQKFYLANAWLSLGIGFLRSKINKEVHVISSWDYKKRKSTHFILNNQYLGAKFILFNTTDSHDHMTYFDDKVSKVETTTRMALKGGIHFLGSHAQPINIVKIHFDGHEHNLRHASKMRIVNRIDGLREYCSFIDDKNLIDDRSSDPNAKVHQEIVDCELLALTDLLIGSFRVALSRERNYAKKQLGKHAKLILDRFQKGSRRMGNSRWADSFSLSRCSLQNNRWSFESLELTPPTSRNVQMKFQEFFL